MAIKLDIAYPGRTDVDGANPNGTFKDSTVPGAFDGTPFQKSWARDMWSFLEILMSVGSEIHNGSPDDATASQRYDALVKIARDVWPQWGAAHTYALGDFTIGSDGNWYQSLVGANTGNDPISSPAQWANALQDLDDLTRDAPRIWNATYDYPIGALTLGSDGKIYKSLVTPNVGNDPTTPSPTQWREFVIDDVVSIFTDVALSANQGKVLKDLIDTTAALILPATETTKGIYFVPKRILLSNNPADPDHDIDTSAGNFVFDDNSNSFAASAFTKKLDVNWVQGIGNGGSPGITLVLNSTYHYFALSNSTGTIIDFGMDIDLAAANLLAYGAVITAGLTHASYQGSFITDGLANIIPTIQNDREFVYKQKILDITDDDPTTGGLLIAMSVPEDIETMLKIHIKWWPTALSYLLITADEQADLVADADNNTVFGTNAFAQLIFKDVKTNLSGEIRHRRGGGSPPSSFSYVVHSVSYINLKLRP